jgi:CubicO group peptidase (beta-lactamase class C family)
MNGGFSKSRLTRLHDRMTGHVERDYVPGIVTLVSRRGDTHVHAVGGKALNRSEPMRRDTIFRITSMTKPITAVATMILVEDCTLRLDEPVERLLPELANRRVLKSLESQLDDTMPASRSITVRDLLTFRLGLGIIFGPPNLYPIQRAITELGITGFGPPMQSTPHDPDDWMQRLGTLPLMHQPGERWMYNTGSCLLGVLIARASGQPFEMFLRERVFEPLGMKDTSFSVPASKLDRLATSYWANPQTGALDLYDGVEDSQWSRPPAFPDGGAGLVSTIDDYLAFGQMLLNEGRLGSERILSRSSIALMTTDQLTPEQKLKSAFVPGQWDARGWGFGVQVVTRRDDVSAVPGQYGWDGGFGTSWRTDPQEEMVAILMTQRAEFPPFSPVYQDFWASVYASIDD